MGTRQIAEREGGAPRPLIFPVRHPRVQGTQWYPAIQPTVDVVAHTVATLGEDRFPLREPFSVKVSQVVCLPPALSTGADILNSFFQSFVHFHG